MSIHTLLCGTCWIDAVGRVQQKHSMCTGCTFFCINQLL